MVIEAPHQQGVQAAVQFIDHQHAAITQAIQHRRDQAVQALRAFGLILQLELGRALGRAVFEDGHQELTLLLAGLQAAGAHHPLGLHALARHGLHVGDGDVGGGQELADRVRPLLGRQHARW
jgi:hypothetical protein